MYLPYASRKETESELLSCVRIFASRLVRFVEQELVAIY
jgi:hypothetical protein